MLTAAARLLRALPAITLLSAPLCAAPVVAPFFNGVFPAQAPGLTGWQVVNAFPNLRFTDPIWIAQVPGSNDMVVVEKAGRIVRFPKNPAVGTAEVSVVLDISSLVQTSEDQGLYRIAFHPQFGGSGPHAGQVFISYNHRPAVAGAGPDKSMWRLSRFTWQAATGTIDPASEEVLIQQYDPDRWHNGGALNFDNDGFLLVTCGDGGRENEWLGLAQKLNGGFFGGVLRIDVDRDPARSHPIRRQPVAGASPSGFPSDLTQGYFIPNDNPWQNANGSILEEFFSLGLRSPHSAHYDPVTGDLWVGDVGQAKQEELNRVRKGENHQWPFMEGAISGPKQRSAPLYGRETSPIYSYDRIRGGCIISGMRYRGARWAAELGGKVLFGDQQKGYLASYLPDAPQPVEEIVSVIGGTSYSGFSNICTDAAGEIYLPKLDGRGAPGGVILILQAAGTSSAPPALLSQTGLFSDTGALVPDPAMIPYDVASPLWSDGAEKKRWIILPAAGASRSGEEMIQWSETGNWSFPAGTIFVKHFEIPSDARNPSLVKRLETRVMVCTSSGGKYGLTYRWNAQGTDAALLSTGEEESFTVIDSEGVPRQRIWSYPSRANCLECHTDAAGQALGLRTHQISMDIIPPGGNRMNQLQWFSMQQMFSPVPANFHNYLQARAIDDETAPLEHRVRSYLDSNCAHCHQPAGGVPYFDARLGAPLKKQGLVNALIKGQFHLPGGCYIKAGEPSLSAIHVRTASDVPGIAMPPLGKHMVDEKAATVISAYIDGLTDEEFATEPVPQGRYVRLKGAIGSFRALSIAEFRILDESGETIPSSDLSVEAVDSEAVTESALLAIDGNTATSWQSVPSGSHFITLDLERTRGIGGFEIVPRQDTTTEIVGSYNVEISTDGIAWTSYRSGNAGSSLATIRYDAMVGRRPVRVSLGAPPHSRSSVIPLTVCFDSPVTDFALSDLIVTGGTVVADSLRGGGYYYTARIAASSPEVTVRMPENGVNSGNLGSRASSMLAVTTDLVDPAVATVAGSSLHHGDFEVRIDFGQPVTGLQKEDFTVVNGTVEYLFQEGSSARVIIGSPSLYSSVNVTLADHAVLGANGLWMNNGFTKSFSYATPVLDTADGYVGQHWAGFVSVNDPVHGYHQWVPEGVRAGNTDAVPNYRLRYNFAVPYEGRYRVRAWTRADDTGSDSFHIGFGSSEGASVFPWQTNQGSAEVGSLQFHAGYARPAGGAPYSFAMSAGLQLLDVYAAEDGTRINRIAIVPERPLPLWSRLPLSPAGMQAELRFTSEVAGLAIDDFEVLDGVVTNLVGSGKNYTITMTPDENGNRTFVQLRENAVTDVESGAPGVRSHPLVAKIRPWTYQEWAADFNVLPGDYRLDYDGDRDGIGQLMEFALGMNPTVSDVRSVVPGDHTKHGMPKLLLEDGPGGKQLVLVYHRRLGGTPLKYTAEFGASPDDLAPVEVIEEVSPLSLQWEEIRVREAEVPLNGRTRFARLRVEKEAL